MSNTCSAAHAISLVFFFAATALAQSISGTISAPDGKGLKDIQVEVTNTATNAVFKTTTTEGGKYAIASLPYGSYDLWVPAQGFAFRYFERRGIALTTGQTVRLDITMEQHLNTGTPGDDPLELLTNMGSRLTPQAGPVPRMPDGTPDLSGFWLQGDGPPPPEPAMLPWATELLKVRTRRNGVDSPSTNCLPSSFPLGFFVKIVQTRDLILVLFEDVVGVRQIFLDGREHPADFTPSWNGHSVGHWERDTLVVETVGITEQTWLSPFGHPHTEQMKIIERFRRTDKGRLELETTILDPGTYLKPWVMPSVWSLDPKEEIVEYVCDNNRDASHLIR